jgi:hypothetical protein
MSLRLLITGRLPAFRLSAQVDQRLTVTQVGEIHMVTPTEDYYSDHDGGKLAPIEATFLIPHQSGIQDAKLVRIEVGERGWPLLEGA